ncbi:hypothetical protein QFC24_001322 [Naganishia onofrii]|uniref:Uncharacterized protein n=1 Tax=Naganishia onofrii TaxID=1851511 RepID=A0ACC2XSY5_9TREE|nr:hypothetical protein QFC24_001322 [Naganishia onofrii]
MLSFNVPDIGSEKGPLKMRKEEGTVHDIARFFYDMKLAGSPLQCNETDGTCEDMEREIDFAPFQTANELNQYKFMFDLDGNGWSARFRRLMTTNSVVLKTGMFTEWFQAHIVPWFHYIPTRLDYSDLPMILSFLRGSPEAPDQGFDEVAQAIAQNGKCFVQRMFRVEDLQAYMFRLFLEYARLVAPTDEGVDFEFTPEPEAELE